MAEAFAGLDEYAWSAVRDAPDSSPDSALDWVFMMHADDWLLLRGAWPHRPAAWREACAYVLGQGPANECLPILELALFDSDAGVCLEAGAGYAALILDAPSPMPVAASTRQRLQSIADQSRPELVAEIRRLLVLTASSAS